MKELLFTIEIPDYIRQIKLSEARRAKYYHPGKGKLPKKYMEKDKFEFRKWKNGSVCLVEIATGERVISNPRSAGTPRFLQINNQYIYSGNAHHSVRAKLVEKLKESYTEYKAVRHMPKIEKFPLIIECELHDLIFDPMIKNQLWDVDNRFYPYAKTWLDYLQEHAIIPDDNCLYVTGPPAVIFYPIKDTERRKIVFHFYHDKREHLQTFDIDLWNNTR